MRKILALVLDVDSFFEMGRYFGRALITGLARIDGVPVGVMANDPRVAAGAIDADAAEKMTRFVDLCDTFRLPVVNFVDNPGFLIGVEAEKRATPGRRASGDRFRSRGASRRRSSDRSRRQRIRMPCDASSKPTSSRCATRS